MKLFRSQVYGDNKAFVKVGQLVFMKDRGEYDNRALGLDQWARASVPNLYVPLSAELTPVSDDASFRRYFRFSEGNSGLIFVDAPPEHEDNESFVRISAALLEHGLSCPEVKAFDYRLGYLAITDLGDRIYLDEVIKNPLSAELLYSDAVTAILKLLSVSCDVPVYDALRLRAEMDLFCDWFLERQLSFEVSSEERAMLEETFECLINSALEQPSAFVHRDFHCRNLMVDDVCNPSIIDFQDALVGPVTYDLVSLYKDCYYKFDRGVIIKVVDEFHQKLVGRGLVTRDSPVLRWFDLMGVQRHLKCLGIFSRLNLRDGKARYLADIPLVFEYLIETSASYPELQALHKWLSTRISPKVLNLKERFE